MFGIAHQPKIIHLIIPFIPIDMMNMLTIEPRYSATSNSSDLTKRRITEVDRSQADISPDCLHAVDKV